MSIKNKPWAEKLAIGKAFDASDEQMCTVFNIKQHELDAARELQSVGSLPEPSDFDATPYASHFSAAPATDTDAEPIKHDRPKITPVTTVTKISTPADPADKPVTATKKVKEPKKRGRKGSRIANAFNAIPTSPTSANTFAAQHNVSINVLRQSKRFDPHPEIGPVRVKKDKDTNELMIWREKSTTTSTSTTKS